MMSDYRECLVITLVVLYNHHMTMNPNARQLEALTARIIAMPTRITHMTVPSDDDLQRLFASILALANALDVPTSALPHLLMLAHDRTTPNDFPYADHLVFLYATMIFTLYAVSDDTFDELMFDHLPEPTD